MMVRLGCNVWIRRAPGAAVAADKPSARDGGIDGRFLGEPAGKAANVRPERAARAIARLAGLSGNAARAAEDAGQD